MNQNNKNFMEAQEKQLSSALSAKLTVENHKQLAECLLRSQMEKSLRGSASPKA